MSLTVTNASEWDRGLRQAFADLEVDCEDQLSDLAANITANMRQTAPEMEPAERQYRQGLSSGKAVRKRPSKVTYRYDKHRKGRRFWIDAGPAKGAFYLAFAEWGTSNQPARPWLRPAIERAVAAWRR